jgi:hypothetical protein
VVFFAWTIAASLSSRSSGTLTTATAGSLGLLCAGRCPAASALNSDVLPEIEADQRDVKLIPGPDLGIRVACRRSL